MIRKWQEAAFVALQYLLPHHLLSRMMLRLTRIRARWFKNFFIRTFIRLFKVDMQRAEQPEPTAYDSFNHFFTRALKPEARPAADAPQAILCPVDGTVSQLGRIEQGDIFQAKGHHYSLSRLLGEEASAIQQYHDGQFATLYLSPRDYHRIHMPVGGKLVAMHHVPGRLFSVNPTTVKRVPNLFARNERVICRFETELGPMAMILVGAIFVASIDTVWHGTVTPPSAGDIQHWDYREHPVMLQKGEEMGRFNMGSTVILLFGKDTMSFNDQLSAGSHVQMGQLLGHTLK